MCLEVMFLARIHRKLGSVSHIGLFATPWTAVCQDSLSIAHSQVYSNSGVGDGQGGLACCGPWGRKELDTTEQLN